jgi:hypothetical protein
MLRQCALTLVLLAIPAVVVAKTKTESTQGPDALAMAALVGEQSPTLTKAERTLLLGYLDGKAGTAHTKGQKVRVTVKSIQCQTSDVDLTERQCELMFGKTRVAVRGRQAEALNATLALLGLPEEGAAGSIYYGLTSLDCTVDADGIKERDGGGAKCQFSYE